MIGPNGAGKTTLLNILSGEDKDFEGDLKIGESVPTPRISCDATRVRR